MAGPETEDEEQPRQDGPVPDPRGEVALSANALSDEGPGEDAAVRELEVGDAINPTEPEVADRVEDVEAGDEPDVAAPDEDRAIDAVVSVGEADGVEAGADVLSPAVIDAGGVSAPTAEEAARGAQEADADIADAIEGHARFRAAFDKDRAFFQTLATAKQKPRLLWIGCSDSRVVPAQITGADPGELFEIRNIANCVPPAHAFDDSVGAAIAYAVEYLGIDDIVVCGHTGCGGIGALIDADDIGGDQHLARWIDLTRPAHALMRAAGVSPLERHDETAKAHVQFQIDNLMTYQRVAEGVAAGRITVHGWLYDMAEGRLLAYDSRQGVWRDLLEGAAVGET